jgi:formylglycine-generating enzyme required for sulfatase activity
VLRGGSWDYYRDYARADYRYGALPGYRFDLDGFWVLWCSPIR